MRRFFLVVGIWVLLMSSVIGDAAAVGLYVVGKEECKCSPLVAAGILPDTWNKLKEATGWRFIAAVVDRVAVEIKTVLGQFGVQTDRFVAGLQAGPDQDVMTKVRPEVTREIKPTTKPKAKPELKADTKKEVRKAPKKEETRKKPKSQKRIQVPPTAE
jgi:hypothetical protein